MNGRWELDVNGFSLAFPSSGHVHCYKVETQPMPTIDTSVFLHVVSYVQGVAIYAMLLAMVWPSAKQSRLILATAVLGLIWNIANLAEAVAENSPLVEPGPWTDAAAYAALGFLPAVVVHSVLRPQLARRQRGAVLLTALVYSMSGIAAASHVVNVVAQGFAPSPTAEHLLGPAFGLVIIPLAVFTRGQRVWRRALWVVALSVVAVAGSSLAYHSNGTWWFEILGHQASLLLAFAILYQDYRFALADLFLKRVLVLVGLVGLVFGGHSAAQAAGWLAVLPFADPRLQGIVLGLGTALAYPALRRAVGWFVDTWVARREPHGRLVADIERLIGEAQTPTDALTLTCERLKVTLQAGTVEWATISEGADPATGAALRVPTSEAPHYRLSITGGSGGRRLSQHDLTLLEPIAMMLARRIDQLRIVHERYEQQLTQQEIAKLATEAELKALRAQRDPHFLFNALNTVGHLIQTAPDRALETLLHLTDLLRRVLRSEGEFTTLGREMELIEAYLEIERARFEERLQVCIDVTPDLRTMQLPPLLILPLVENAIKHGIARNLAGGTVTVTAERVDSSVGTMPELHIRVINTAADPGAEQLGRQIRLGVGLKNLERRLQMYYGPDGSVSLDDDHGSRTTVEVTIPAERGQSSGWTDRHIGQESIR